MTEPQSPDVRPQPYTASPPSRGGGAGAVSLVIGLVLVALGVVQQIVNAFIPQIMFEAGLSGAQIGLVFTVTTVVLGVIAIPGVIAGLIGIQRSRTSGRLAAAAGLALCGAQLLGSIVAVLVPLAVGALHGLSGAF